MEFFSYALLAGSFLDLYILHKIKRLTILIQKARNSQAQTKELNKSTRRPKKGGPSKTPILIAKKEKPIPSPAVSLNESSPTTVKKTAFHPIPVRPKQIERR
jgi:hypothetical protein